MSVKPKIVIVVQARTGSSRLPNKILMPLVGKPLLVRMMERVMASRLAAHVVVATTTDTKDDTVENICKQNGFDCFRGHPTDLLDRHYWAGIEAGADVVVKIPSDCPLIDPKVIDIVLQFYLDHETEYDFVSNLHPATFPDGNDVEVIPMPVLQTAWHEATKPLEREHTTPFIWENPNRFRIGNVVWETGLDYSMTHRWTIDYEEDYNFIKAVYNNLYAIKPLFGIDDVLGLTEKRPDIKALNEKFAGVNWYRNHLAELKTVSASQTKII
jgi:spore coat polysaccharide biosynthesis protein SpsF